MDIEIKEVQEIIKNLDGGGELSIKEEKYLKVAKLCVQLAAENVALKSFGDKLDEMHNDLNGEGTGIQGRSEVTCQQVALEAAIEEFDAIETPDTDAYLAGIKADGVEEEPFGFVSRSGDLVVIELNGDRHIRDGMPVFVKALREGADKC